MLEAPSPADVPAAEFETVIGLEVHAQLLTESKAFAPVSNRFGNQPNTQVTPLCLGHPGTLPLLNENLVNYIVKMGLATHCQIAPRSIFARKNYFYPDMPKGYQISQFDKPICHDGHIDIELEDGSTKRIRIKRIHMEEDAGKSIHDQDPQKHSHRPEPLRHAPDRNCYRTGYFQSRRGLRLPGTDQADCAVPGHLRWKYGGGKPAMRCQYFHTSGG